MKTTLFSILVMLTVATPTIASVVRFENDYAGFLTAAGATHTIDFETLPDGNTPNAQFITATFNYDSQGAHFSSHLGTPRIAGNPQSGFDLDISTPGQRNWLIADMVSPTYAVGIHYGGGTSLSIYDSSNNLIATRFFNSGPAGAARFLGFVSDTPIARAVIDRLADGERIDDFTFAIPEPVTASLFAIGLSGVLLRRRRSSCLH